MGSLIMHLYISEQIRKKYNFGTSFLVGAILPDIKKINGENRNKTHYIVERRKDRIVSRLPEVDNYIAESKKENNKELRYGYVSHLIQDNIWFKEFIPKFGEEIGVNSFNDEIFVFPNENKKIIRSREEFLDRIYSDYKVFNFRIKEQFGRMDTLEIQKLVNNYTNLCDEAKQKMNEYLEFDEKQGSTFFIDDNLIRDYFNKCIEENSKKIEKMMMR